MSEFTDFYALLTDAQTLSDLRGVLTQSVEGAYVPLDELPYAALDSEAAMQAAWAKHPKPAWIKVGLPWNEDRDTLEDLASAGPAVHIKVEEDFSSWSLHARCGGQSFFAAMLVKTEMYREATDGVPVFEGNMETASISSCLKLEDKAFRATLVPDGGESFSAAVGITYEQMLDMELEDVKAGDFTFGLGF